MLRSLPSNSDARIRLLAKFVENEYEKLSRLVSIRREFSSKMSTIDNEIALERSNLSQEEQEERVDEWFSRKLDAGLFSLQVIVFFFFSLFLLGGAKSEDIYREQDKKKPPKKKANHSNPFCNIFLDSRRNPRVDGSRRHWRQAPNRKTPLRSRRDPSRFEENPTRFVVRFFFSPSFLSLFFYPLLRFWVGWGPDFKSLSNFLKLFLNRTIEYHGRRGGYR